jgi:hypothetical protein
MKTLPTLLLFATSLLLASCETQSWRADVGAMFVAPRGQVALQNAGGTLVLHDEQNDLENDLGLGSAEVAPYLRAQMDDGAHRVRAHGFLFDAEGTGVLAGDFGGITAGSAVETSMDFYNLSTAYSFALLHDEVWRLGVGGQLGIYGFDITARSGGGREEVETSLIVPMPYVDAEVRLGDIVTVGGNAGLMAGDFGDGSGRYWDAEIWGRVQATDEIEFIGGYRYLLLDAYGKASSRDFDADLDMHGWFIGGGIRF